MEARRERLLALKGDVVETDGKGMPAGARGGFGSHHVRFGQHFHRATAQRAVHQANLEFERRSGLNMMGE